MTWVGTYLASRLVSCLAYYVVAREGKYDAIPPQVRQYRSNRTNTEGANRVKSCERRLRLEVLLVRLNVSVRLGDYGMEKKVVEEAAEIVRR